MMKAAKKLKLWPKKKKKKKRPPPPTQLCHGCCCSSCSLNQPSAPPLPPWLDLDLTREAAAFEAPVPSITPTTPHVTPQFPQQPQPQEHVSEISSLIQPELPVNYPSYQQYMAPSPAYGVPIAVPMARPERGRASPAGIGMRLIHCFCPCFQVQVLNDKCQSLKA